MPSDTLDLTRALSIRAPIANEEERAQFQRRVGLTCLVIFVLSGGYWVVAMISLALIAPSVLGPTAAKPTSLLTIGTSSLGVVFWAFTRGRARSVAGLEVADGLSVVAICTGWAFIPMFEPPAVRPDLIAMLACTFTLVMRAALVPSTPARTALFSGAALVPLIVVTQRQVVVEPSLSPLGPAAYLGIWTLLAMGATTTTTWVTFGLRLQMRKAMQLGQYFLEEKIGEGGMGAVYRARHVLLRRPTAIKLLSGGDEHASQRFEREVQITAELTHPNTVAVFDYGRTPDGVFYYAMEYLEGVSLQDLVERAGPQPPSRVVHVLLQVCGALEEAHAAGLVHRDIKPANVMLTSRGGILDFAKVLDFGLVKEVVRDGDAAVTSATAILGTPHYMAPEAILQPESIDGRADLYATGAMAFFMLTGAHVFAGHGLVEICGKHVHEAPSSPSAKAPGVPASLDAIVLACLAKDPAARPADAAALTRMLRESGVAPWTKDDALAWWAEHAGVTPRARTRARGARPAAAAGDALDSTLGATIAVAVNGRGPR